MFSALSSRVAVLAFGTLIKVVLGPLSCSASSFSDLNIEYGELKVAFDNVLGENKQLREAVRLSEATIAAMRTNLADVGGESEIFKRQTLQMKLRIDALGLESPSSTNTTMEQRLLNAVSDLRATTIDKKRLSEALIRLLDAVSLYTKTTGSGDPLIRLSLETEIRNANAALGSDSINVSKQADSPGTANGGSVISIKDELALVVMNLGSKQGVKVGMPFQVTRDNKIIGSVRAVDVREKIAGAVIQNLSSENLKIKVGDHLKVAAEQ